MPAPGFPADNHKWSQLEAHYMTANRLAFLAPLILVACAADLPTEARYDPLEHYEELKASTILDAPDPVAGSFAPAHLYQVKRGEYLVELLGCGACHTDGALEGAPEMKRSLAGSRVGIAYTNPLGDEYPGVIYPPNLTPDAETGLGLWNDLQIEHAIRTGIGQHAGRRLVAMPWQGYRKMTQEDASAIVAYLRSIPAVRHKVPDEVTPGKKAKEPYIYFGVYRSR
jgi:mono/diheme cytochrome c family protein